MDAMVEALTPIAYELAKARPRTDALFELVPQELLYARTIPERHRLAFYLGHVDAFDANLLLGDAAGLQPSFKALSRRFAFGIDPVGGNLPNEAAHDWPPIADIRRYVAEARSRIDDWLPRAQGLIDGVPVATLLHTAIEHRLMHAETLAYLINRLPIAKPLRAVPLGRRQPPEEMVPVPAGIAILGAGGDEAFAWDNERPGCQEEVPAFAIDRCMVTNGQFLRFMAAGGYAEPRWWQPADWQWRSHQNVSHPASWRPAGGEWQLVSAFDLVPFQADWPVYVSHAEAAAYAAWAGKQLPSEAQWHRAAYGTPTGEERPFPWGREPPAENHGNFDFQRWDPQAVDAHPAGTSAFGVTGLLGNGWEWTRTPFAPFPGFSPFAFYRGYSADFFDGRHFVLKGGSAHTAVRLLRRSFRNWFQAHYPYPFAGFRCVLNP
ncbi:MAG TPA: SUMF1/EgtB/PvdO family nonheme iron enzyme [Rhodocyclaceae bacterium]|nr:SUMF1/EgtB/PvdO family nonheme iron enzyme [Rhodocyclaceae bacterium]